MIEEVKALLVARAIDFRYLNSLVLRDHLRIELVAVDNWSIWTWLMDKHGTSQPFYPFEVSGMSESGN